MTRRLALVCAGLAVAVACSRSTESPSSESLSPAAPSAVTTPSAVAAPAANAATPGAAAAGRGVANGRSEVTVNMADACDPDSFNAAVGPGACARSGGMKFDQFIETLTRLTFVGAWHFAPNTAHVRVGQTFVARNMGGEEHTFTEVAQFGGGIIPILNQLANTPVMAPECGRLEDEDHVAPGATYEEQVEHAGHLRFQCCIHPWMRLEADASGQ
jgi:plastocyanin